MSITAKDRLETYIVIANEQPPKYFTPLDTTLELMLLCKQVFASRLLIPGNCFNTSHLTLQGVSSTASRISTKKVSSASHAHVIPLPICVLPHSSPGDKNYNNNILFYIVFQAQTLYLKAPKLCKSLKHQSFLPLMLKGSI